MDPEPLDARVSILETQMDDTRIVVFNHKHLAFDRTKLLDAPASTASSIVFGGTGADGDFAITSGTTTIDLGGASIFIKNYESISITGTAVLAFSNPAAGGTVIVLKSKGDVTLTSSATPMIDASGMGAAGGSGGAVSNSSGAVTKGVDGTTADSGFIVDGISHSGGGGGKDGNGGGTGGTGGVGPAMLTIGFYTRSASALIRRSINIYCGSGGGGGGGGQSSGTPNSAGSGGRGGGGLYIECAGALNFTTTNGISVSGKNGGSVTGGGTSAAAGAGGGGSCGMCLILYTTLTANSGTCTAKGGDGGNGANPGSGGNPSAGGGGGAGGISGAGGLGGVGVAAGNNGSAGSNGAGAGAGGGGGSSAAPGFTGGTGGTGQTDSGALTVAQNLFIA